MGGPTTQPYNPPPTSPHIPLSPPPKSFAPLHICTCVCKPIHNSANRTCGVIWGGGPTTQPYNPPPTSTHIPLSPPTIPCALARLHTRVQAHTEHWKENLSGVTWGGPTTHPYNPPHPPPISLDPPHNPLRLCTFAHACARTEVTLGRQLEWGHMGGGSSTQPYNPPTTSPHIPLSPPTIPCALARLHTRVQGQK